jgi:hypothetical protein
LQTRSHITIITSVFFLFSFSLSCWFVPIKSCSVAFLSEISARLAGYRTEFFFLFLLLLQQLAAFVLLACLHVSLCITLTCSSSFVRIGLLLFLIIFFCLFFFSPYFFFFFLLGGQLAVLSGAKKADQSRCPHASLIISSLFQEAERVQRTRGVSWTSPLFAFHGGIC